jgi:hypothetical protein
MQYPEKGESQHPQGKFQPRAKRSHRVIGGDDPVNKKDPTGHDFDIGSLSFTIAITSIVFSIPSNTASHDWQPEKELYTLPGLKPFYAPPNTDWNAIQETGAKNGKNPVEDALNEGPGGHFDFQRPQGYFGPVYLDFRIAANLGVGIYMEGAGYTLDEMLTEVTGFAAGYSNANQTSSSFYWGYGYTSAKNGILPQPYQP